ncbi:MAG: hypothetical protein BAJALOKI1v1_1440003 [Promethearchaeota archaeon]|nr:MAG: hypothetical protein BAJALOKI1v1_1440003 [Candidatus Lokiarchaeota archaeon]
MKLNKSDKEVNYVAQQITQLRQKTLKNRKKWSAQNLNKPVAFWTKTERLLNEIGKEFTIILRTRGCEWALKHGGCSMCGYIEDAAIENVESSHIISQFDYAINQTVNKIKNSNDRYVLKIFNSGSFFDDNEITSVVREHIYRKIAEIREITEFSMESRVEYITQDKLDQINQFIPDKHVEVGIGLESVTNHIRNTYINKNVSYADFIESINLCARNRIGSKIYLLFKPPFLNEQAAIDDCASSIKEISNLKVNTISINPCNIQKGSLIEYLWYTNRYRPPWFYSLFDCFKMALTPQTLKKIRILCDPSGAGSKRGIHNCLRKTCNEKMKHSLREFVFHQDLSQLDQIDYDCVCKKKYEIIRSS